MSPSPELTRVLSCLEGVKRSGSGHIARCPAHDDRTASLSLADGREGVVLTCHAGCSAEAVLSAVGLSYGDLFPPKDAAPPMPEAPPRRAASYDYEDEAGRVLFRVVRLEYPDGRKTFRQERYEDGRFRSGMTGADGQPVRRVLYHLPRIREAAEAGRIVFIVEGEKDVHTLERLGFAVTTSPGGAGKWRDEYVASLTGAARVVVLPDNDAAGRRHAGQVVRACLAAGLPVRIVELPGLPEKGDVTDWVEAGGSADNLRRLVNAMPDVDEALEGISAELDEEELEAEPEITQLDWLPFPVATLPQAVRAFIEAHAHVIGCDVAFLAVPALAVLAAAVGNSAWVRLNYGWTAPPALWTVLIAPSGSAKSPALDAVMRPIYALEREAARAYEHDVEEYEAEKAAAKKAKSREHIPAPKRRRYRMGDTTVESVILTHADNPRGLLVARDELAGWLGSFDRYAKGGASDAQTWIEMHGGRPVTVDRKSNAERPVLYVERPCVSVTGGIQPGVLTSQLKGSHFASGFAARLLMAAPPVQPRAYRMARGPVQEVEAAYRDLLLSLYAACSDDPAADPLELELTDEARSVFADFVNTNGKAVVSLPEASPLRAAWSKADGTCGSLALVLDRATRAGWGEDLSEAEPVTADSMRAAVHLTRWFQRETLRLYLRYGFDEADATPEEELCGRLPETFTWQDVAKESRIQTKSGALKRIRRLISLGLVRKLGRAEYEVVRKPDPLEKVSAQLLGGHFGHFGHLHPENLENEPGSRDTARSLGVHRQDTTGTPSDPAPAESAKVSGGAGKVSNGRTPKNGLIEGAEWESVQSVQSVRAQEGSSSSGDMIPSVNGLPGAACASTSAWTLEVPDAD